MLLYNKMTLAQIQNNFSLEISGKVSSSFMYSLIVPFSKIIILKCSLLKFNDFLIYWNKLNMKMNLDDINHLTSWKDLKKNYLT